MRILTFDDLEREQRIEEERKVLPWVQGHVWHEGSKCALCGGDIGVAMGTTMRGEDLHQCLDCSAMHRSVPRSRRGERFLAGDD